MNHSENNLPHCHFVHHTTYTWTNLGLHLDLHCERSATNRHDPWHGLERAPLYCKDGRMGFSVTSITQTFTLKRDAVLSSKTSTPAGLYGITFLRQLTSRQTQSYVLY